MSRRALVIGLVVAVVVAGAAAAVLAGGGGGGGGASNDDGGAALAPATESTSDTGGSGCDDITPLLTAADVAEVFAKTDVRVRAEGDNDCNFFAKKGEGSGPVSIDVFEFDLVTGEPTTTIPGVGDAAWFELRGDFGTLGFRQGSRSFSISGGSVAGPEQFVELANRMIARL
ncbi:MAG TPA: hypothetical protein VIH82_10740 [Acidimicrobiia bacterium]